MLFAAVDMADSDQLLRHLLAVGRDYHRSHMKSSSCRELPRFYWIFRNMDYEQWWSAKGSQVLWLSGPADCDISDASSCIVDLAKEISAEAKHSALYFFCSTKPTRVSIAVIFVSTIVSQLVCRWPQLKEQVANIFLHTLLNTLLSEENLKWSDFKRGDSVEATVKKILQAPSEGYWSALRAVMGLEHRQELYLVIDGLDKAGQEFIRGVHFFIESLQGCPSTIRVLLTSRPQADIKEILGGLPCIEYDKERKGLIALFLICLISMLAKNCRVPE